MCIRDRLKAQRHLGEHMLFVVNQVIGGDAEHPGGKRALPPERGQVGDHLQQNVLGRVLGVGKCPQHAQRQIEHHVLEVENDPFQGLLIPLSLIHI